MIYVTNYIVKVLAFLSPGVRTYCSEQTPDAAIEASGPRTIPAKSRSREKAGCTDACAVAGDAVDRGKRSVPFFQV